MTAVGSIRQGVEHIFYEMMPGNKAELVARFVFSIQGVNTKMIKFAIL
jgi:hypothetical protein